MPLKPRPSFRNPPVNEVVCGIQFRPLTSFDATHFGLFWNIVRKEFPRSRTVSPLTDPVGISTDDPVTLNLGLRLPRAWFISQDDASLIQLQTDRFLFNWREGVSNADYPRFRQIFKNFKRLYKKFEKFVSDADIGELIIMNGELSYINHVTKETGWEELSDMGEIFPDYSWRRGNRLTPPPESFFYRSTHDLEIGKLTLLTQSATKKSSGEELIRFDVTVKGSLSGLKTEVERWNWYSSANTVIVDTFVDMTSKSVQRVHWQRER